MMLRKVVSFYKRLTRNKEIQRVEYISILMRSTYRTWFFLAASRLS